MHSGKIQNNTKAGQVYAFLKQHPGWHGGWELAIATGTTAISTRISEIRSQLPPNERIEVTQKGKRWYYRLVRKNPEIPLGL